MGEISFVLVKGNDLQNYFKDIARIRITVFKEWPYLYLGSEDYEREYLQVYFKNERSLGILVKDADQVVGISTLMPLDGEHEDLKNPLLQAGYDISRIFYYSESCLLPAYRGKGIYKEFFRLREEHVRSFGADYDKVCFCSVIRPDNHPLRPRDYRPLDPIWQSFEFNKVENPKMSYDWTDLNESEETKKYLSVWFKDL